MLHYSPSGSNKYINVHFTDGYQVLSVLGLGRYGFHHIYIQMSGVYGVEIYDPKVTTLFSWFPDGQTERKPIVEIIDKYNAKIYMSILLRNRQSFQVLRESEAMIDVVFMQSFRCLRNLTFVLQYCFVKTKKLVEWAVISFV